ncbi:MAG: hypothetical protein GY754_06920 [bacterium]|nr:hypothetical protein [bacterium]
MDNSGATTTIPEDVKEKLPGELDLVDIGSIDLSEAEAIANEDILFLTEEDLVEGLEDFDLIPLKNQENNAAESPGEDRVAGSSREPVGETGVTAAIQEDSSAAADVVAESSALVTREKQEIVEQKPVEPVDLVQEGISDPGIKTSQKEQETRNRKDYGRVREDHINKEKIEIRPRVRDMLQGISKKPGKLVPVSGINEVEKPDKFAELDTDVEIIQAPEEEDVSDAAHEDVSGKEASSSPEETDSMEKSSAPELEETPEESPAAGDVESETIEEEAIDETIDEINEEFIYEDSDLLSLPEKKEKQAEAVEKEDVLLEESHTDESENQIEQESNIIEEEIPVMEAAPVEETSTDVEISESVQFTDDLETEKEYTPVLPKETLPDNLQALEMIDDHVVFIDDDVVEKPEVELTSLYKKDILERIGADIIEVDEANALVLYEAESEADRELIANVMIDSLPVFEDLLLDFEDIEYKYKDDELDFIYSALVEEDYSRYIMEIDEFHGIEGRKDITNAVELFGMTPDEITLVQDNLFADEYKDVDLERMFDLLSFEAKRFRKFSLSEIECNYMLPFDDSLIDSEKLSIEEDITSEGALIFEEDSEEIRELLNKTVGEEKPGTVEIVDTIYDITDSVVILEDETDVDRFVSDLPGEKQDDMKKLFKYLDGLFEKLPEKTVKSFANSEYFDLYLKVLDDMGI